jgi:hypothetical protein
VATQSVNLKVTYSSNNYSDMNSTVNSDNYIPGSIVFNSINQSSLKVGETNTYIFNFSVTSNIVSGSAIDFVFPDQVGLSNSLVISASIYGTNYSSVSFTSVS